MEKNCTNCTFNIPVEGMNHAGVCANTLLHTNMTSEHTVCSRYQVKELPKESSKNAFSNLQETIEALTCCTDSSRGCASCPFNRYKCTCQQDLMFAALQLLCKQKYRIEVLEKLTSGKCAHALSTEIE